MKNCFYIVGVVLLCLQFFVAGMIVDLFGHHKNILKLNADVARKNAQIQLLKEIIEVP